MQIYSLNNLIVWMIDSGGVMTEECWEANNLLVVLTPRVSNMAVNIHVD